MHPAEIPQGFVPPGRKETRPAALACGQGSGGENWWPPLECPGDLSLLAPYFLGIFGGAVGRPSPCCTGALVALPCRGQQPQRPCVWLLWVQPWLVSNCSAPVLETSVLLCHEEQGPRGQGEGKLVFLMSASLRVVAVFVLQDEMQEHDREWYHKTQPFFFGLKGPRALKGSPGLAALVETTQQRDMWPHKGHGCSPATDCRHEQSHRNVQSHTCSHTCSQAQGLHTQMSLQGWTHTATSMALTMHSKTWAHMPSLPLPLWCQTLKEKNFYYLKGPPVQCLFFPLSLFFLMRFGNWPVSFIPSIFPRLKDKLKKGIHQSKRTPTCQAIPLSKWPC